MLDLGMAPGRRLLLCGSAALLVASLAAGPTFAADPGDTALTFLKIGVGARAAAMGEAYVAVAQDPTAIYWNPAGIANAPNQEFHATHNEWIDDVRYEYVAAVNGLKGHAFGVHVGLLHMGEIDERDEAGNLLGHFRAYDMTTGLTYARRISRSVEIGATGKVLYSKIQDYSATAYAGDFGARYRTPIRGLTIAGTMSHIGTNVKFIDESSVLPATVRVGAAYRSRKLLEGFLIAADLAFPNDSGTRSHLGGEVQVHPMFALRGGAKFGYDEEVGTVGFGVNYREYGIDYAYTPFSETSDLGDVHRFSIGWRPLAR